MGEFDLQVGADIAVIKNIGNIVSCSYGTDNILTIDAAGNADDKADVGDGVRLAEQDVLGVVQSVDNAESAAVYIRIGGDVDFYGAVTKTDVRVVVVALWL